MDFSDQTIYLEETSSTNNYLKDLQFDDIFREGLIVTTTNQTAGRGQTGNQWLSEVGKNLTFSLLLKPNFVPIDQMFMISKIVSIAIVEYFNTIKSGFKIKWPNDIYFQNRKIGGILVENQLMGSTISHAVIGIGLNINQKNFSASLPNPISLIQITGVEHNLKSTLNGIIENIFHKYDNLSHESWNEISTDYFNMLYLNQGFHAFKDEEQSFKAQIIRVEPDGELILETESREVKAYYFKEVEFILEK